MTVLRALPAALSLSRAVFMPFIMQAILAGADGRALMLSLAAGFTDFLDGRLARRFGWVTRAGAWLDAISDKVLLSGIYIAFYWAGRVPGWFAAIVFGRDIFILVMAAAGLLLTNIRDFPPSVWGKLSTCVQIGLCLVLLAGPDGWTGPGIMACAVMTGFSGLHYFFLAIRRLRGLQSEPD